MGDVREFPPSTSQPTDDLNQRPGGDEPPAGILGILLKDEQDLLRKLELCRAEIKRWSGEKKAEPFVRFSDALDRRRSIGDRYATGLPTLDKRIGGGLYGGTLTVFQGKPGIGKTMLATQVALQLGRKCAVAALYADEGLPSAIVRIGQQLGHDRRALLRNEPEPVARAKADFLGLCPFWEFLDPGHPLATIEYLAEAFDALAPIGMQRVWLIDSAQVIRLRRQMAREDRRMAVSRALVTIRDLAVAHNAIALVVSQVGRGAYRSKREDERIDPLAAGLETSAIEFMADLILHLDGNPKETVKLSCPKNRLDAEGGFEIPLRIEYARAKFFEVDELEAEAEAVVEKEKTSSALQERVLAELRKNPDGLSKQQLTEIVPGRRVLVAAAVDELYTAKKIFNQPRPGKGGGMIWRALS